MSKRLALGAALGLVLFRLSTHRKSLDEAWNLCSVLEKHRKHALKVEGSLSGFSGNRVKIENPVIFLADKGIPWAGDFYIEKGFWSQRPDSGHQIEVRGRFFCKVALRNPSSEADGRGSFSRPVVSVSLTSPTLLKVSPKTSSFETRIGSHFRNFATRGLAPYPGLKALALASWTGDGSELGDKLIDLYRDGGLLHLLALSGQHVGALALLLGALIWVTSFLLFRLGWAKAGRLGTFLFHQKSCLAGLLLFFTSQGLPSLLRAFSMILGVSLLRVFKRHTNPVQSVASTTVILVLWDPSLVESVGFILSVAGTWILASYSPPHVGWKDYFRDTILLSILVLPVSIFFFGRFCLLSPVLNIFLGALWGFFLIPAGFLLPFLSFLPSGILQHGEWGWQWLAENQNHLSRWVETSSAVFPRPTLIEVILWEALLLALVRKCFAMTPHSLLYRPPESTLKMG